MTNEYVGVFNHNSFYWKFQEGWHKYLPCGSAVEVVVPEEDAYVFDVEVCMSNGKVPTLACAASHKAW